MKKNLISIIALSFFANTTIIAKVAETNFREHWNGPNTPGNMGSVYETNLTKLPKAGQTAETPWTDTYWPTYKGGIAYRYLLENDTDNEPQALPFYYKLFNKEELKKLSAEDLKKLSPAEKFDIFMSRYDYPTVKMELQRTSPKAETWFGICHGWAPASYIYKEPLPITLTNVDQTLQVPFGSSDIKALLSYYQGELSDPKTYFLGSRCDIDLKKYPDAATREECRDVNAGAFHIVLTNEIGVNKKAFVIDRTRDIQVWNQPVFAYHTAEKAAMSGKSPGAADGTVKEIQYQTTIYYTREVFPRWLPLNGTNDYNAQRLVYNYRVELDDKDNIIGGEWLDYERPDFMWTQEAPHVNPRSYYGRGIRFIYQNSISQAKP